MGLFLESMARRATNAVKNWWLLLIAGLLLVAVGIVVFCYPAGSYLTFAWLFGIVFLVSGIAQVGLSFSRNIFLSRGGLVAGGILDIILGLILLCNIYISLVIMPVILGLWILYHGFMTIGLAGDLNAFAVKGSGWLLAGGILLVVIATLVLIYSQSFGKGLLVALFGVGFIVCGVLSVVESLKLRNINVTLKDLLN
ncbi:MAG: DUF308 domain-containing protein [Tidjanibacter sp.]|nr:DUF308 domain-containing protein [Tidjanibacter sp.]